MYQVLITVLSVELKKELIKQYGCPKMSKCPRHKEGESFIADFRKLDGFCEDAWGCMEKYVFALAHTKDPLFWNDWSRQGSAVVCCNDGYRPVTFLLKTLDKMAKPF